MSHAFGVWVFAVIHTKQGLKTDTRPAEPMSLPFSPRFDLSHSDMQGDGRLAMSHAFGVWVFAVIHTKQGFKTDTHPAEPIAGLFQMSDENETTMKRD